MRTAVKLGKRRESEEDKECYLLIAKSATGFNPFSTI